MDLMLITATEDIDDNQIFFENARERYKPINRIVDEYILDEWDIFTRKEGIFNEEESKISGRQEAINRISRILETLS